MTPTDLIEWRRRLGLTQQQAADRLGCARRSIQNWEKEGATIPLYIALACAALARKKPLKPWSRPMTEAWYAFRAYNTESLYGYGTPDEASRWEDILNEGRDINHYGAHRLTAEEAAELRLDQRDDVFNIEDALARHDGFR